MILFKTSRTSSTPSTSSSSTYRIGSLYCYVVVTLLIAINCGQFIAGAAVVIPMTNFSSDSTGNVSMQSHQNALKSTTSLPSSSNVNPIIQKYAISDLIRDLNVQLKSIEDHELLVSAIQSAFDSFEWVPSSTEHNDTKLLNMIATKIETKLSTALRILNETNKKFREILSEHRGEQTKQLWLDAILLPCSTTAKHSERSAHDLTGTDQTKSHNDFIGGINKKKAIEVLNFLKNAGHLHENDDHNFTINKRLMDTMKSIDLTQMSANVPHFRDVFFLPIHSQVSSANCRNTVPSEHHRFLYASSILSKKILLIIDIGAHSINSESLEVTKSFAQIILNLMNDDDQLMLLAISNTIHTIDNFNTFVSMNSTSKGQFRKFIDALEKDASAITNHTLAFEYAFQLIASQFDWNGRTMVDKHATPLQILYVSRGSIMHSSDAKAVLETIAIGQSQLKQPIIINTCAIIFDDKDGTQIKEFLSDISSQNYTKYGINVNVSTAKNAWLVQLQSYNQKGSMYIVNHRNTNDMYATATAAVTDIWFEKQFLKSQIIVHQPFYDQSVKDQIIYITKSCQDYGIVGISMYLSDVAEDLIYHFNQYSNGGDETYAFLCDKNGLTVWHPSFPRPNIASYDSTYATDIRYFEKMPDTIRQRWLNDETGIVQISKAHSWNRKKSKVYRWRRLADWYVVCLVHILPQSDAAQPTPDKIATASSFHAYTASHILTSASHTNTDAFVLSNISVDAYPETENKLVFHRLDLTITTKLNEDIAATNAATDTVATQSPPKLCQYFKQISILDTPTLYLSPRSFKSPFQHLSTMCETDEPNAEYTDYREQCSQRIENIMAYIKDTTNLLTNPGLQPHVRNDVLILAHSIEMLRIQHQYRSKIEKYVIRRYITSMNGIVLMYPGFSLPNDFDPSRRGWYQRAMENVGKLTVTPPYLDIGGAGFVVTISYVIFEKAASANGISGEQRAARTPAAIVSIDVTLGFLYQVLLQSSDYCRSDENIKCFVIDDYGYLVVYPNHFDTKMQLSLYDSQFNINEHITHRESLIANDILLHKLLVEKRMCQNLLNRKVERYYKFNTSLTGALTNVVNGERTKYQIEAVPNTNLFVIMKNSTEGGGGAAFCPCSTVDKVCFNCKRIELMNCECPCECSIEHLNTGSIITEYMYGDLLEDEKNALDKKISLFDSIDVCARPAEEFIPNKKAAAHNEKLNGLNQCVNFTCEQYANQLDCLGILGCVWCEIDIDQMILLSPFCTHQSSCFGGTLGANTPYGDGDIGVIIDSILPSAFAAIGPIAIGAVVVLFLVIGFAMYCYRNNLEPGAEHLYIESMAVEHNFGLPLSRLDYDTILPHNNGGLGNDTVDKRNNAGTITSDSPYRSNYFRRLPNGESDHGYSTMTPHDDSDHACFTLVEPLINTKCSNQSISDSASFNTEPATSCHNYGPSLPALHLASKTMDGFISPVKNQHFDTATAKLSSPHHIQAPVTVHHPMEAIL